MTTQAACLCPGCTELAQVRDEVTRVREALRVGSQSGGAFDELLRSPAATPEQWARGLEDFRMGLGVMKAVLLDTASLEGLPG